jgi:predicted extracellular nuclease
MSAQVLSGKNEFSIMFYNTENFFDVENDSITRDDEFTKEGDRRWTSGKLHVKAERLAKVILAAGKWNAPVLIGLCEIENRDVLELLCKIEPLNRFHYKIVQKDSPDLRGIDVALIYRPDLFRPTDYLAIPVVDPDDKSFKTRDILQVSGVLNGCDTIHVFVNHWPSRYGGIMETQKYRRMAALTLKTSVQKVLSQQSKAKVVCMGDFNDTPADESLTTVLEAKQSDTDENGELINLSAPWTSYDIQTIKSKYRWEVFDQFIVSDYFLAPNKCYQFKGSEIFKAPFLLEPDISYGGVKPKRTYIGYRYSNGFSDHLPVLLRFSLSGY